jgi:hypothetical protein
MVNPHMPAAFQPKWLVFKRKTKDGRSRAWYALHEVNGNGGLFVGSDAWEQAMRFVDSQVRAERGIR